MEVVWDKEKRLQNLRKHEIDFAEVKSIFESDPLLFEDDRFGYDEERWLI